MTPDRVKEVDCLMLVLSIEMKACCRFLRHWRSIGHAVRRDSGIYPALRRHLDDETYRALQLAMLLRPAQGPLIQGGAGLRKLRWAALGRGKRGGVRLIYYWEPASQIFYMLYLYAKNEQGDLTATQLKVLAKLVREEFT